MLCLLVQVTGVFNLTLFTRSLCNLIITVILNVFILRFFCEIGVGGMMNLVYGSLFSSFMASLVLLVLSGDDELSLRFIVLLLCDISWFLQ